MAEGRVRLVGVPSTGPGCRELLQSLAADSDILTSFDDARLKAARDQLAGLEECDLVPFGELVGRFLDMQGEPRKLLASPSLTVAGIGSICQELDADSALFAWRDRPGGHKEIAEAISDLQHWGLTARRLEELVPLMSERVQWRLGSLCEVMAKLDGLLESLGRESNSSRVDRCTIGKMAHRGPIRRITLIYGGEERPLYEKWIAWAADQGVEIDVLLDWHPRQPRMFEASQRAADRMGRKIIDLFGKDEWWGRLFGEEEPGEGPEACIFTAADPLAEAEWTIRRAYQMHVETGLPHDQVQIFCRDTETYAPLLSHAARRLGVRLRLKVTAPLLTNGFAKLVLETLRTLAGDDVRPLYRLARSNYVSATPTQLSQLWTAVRTATQERENAWPYMEKWAAERAEEFAWLDELLRWRLESEDRLAPLPVWLGQLREIVGASKLSQQCAEVEATRDRDLNAQTMLQRSLAELTVHPPGTTLPDLNLRQFVRLAERAWTEAMYVCEQGRSGIEAVTNTSSLRSAQAIFVLGMLEGSMPRRRSEAPLLDDQSITELSEASKGEFDLPDSFAKARRERAEFVRLCAGGSAHITFSYPLTDEDRDNVPASYLDELPRVLKEVKTETHPRTQLTPPAEECVSPADLHLRQALDGPRVQTQPAHLVTADAMEIVRADLDAGVSLRELQSALECPFRSAAAFRLKLRGPRSAAINMLLMELVRNSAILQADSVEAAREKLEWALGQLLEEQYPDLESWELQLLETAARRRIDEWVAKEFAARETWPRDEGDVISPVSLGEHGLRQEFKLPKQGGIAGSITLTEHLPGMYRVKGIPVLQLYEPLPWPIPNNGAALETLTSGSLREAVLLMMLARLGAGGGALDIQDAKGERAMVYAGTKASQTFRPSREKGLRARSFIRDFGRQAMINVGERMADAAEALSGGDMQATPGDHCSTCSLGELCRVSMEFGDWEAADE